MADSSRTVCKQFGSSWWRRVVWPYFWERSIYYLWKRRSRRVANMPERKHRFSARISYYWQSNTSCFSWSIIVSPSATPAVPIINSFRFWTIFVYGHNYSGEYPLDENCRKSGTNLHPKLSISTHLQNPRLTAMLIYLQPTSAFGTQGTSRARVNSPGRTNGRYVIVVQAIIWPEVQQNQAS